MTDGQPIQPASRQLRQLILETGREHAGVLDVNTTNLIR
jgi:hypothetical protein